MAIIYKTTCLINNKIYVGQSKNNNKAYLGSGRIFLKAIKKYGKENFIKEILIEGNITQDELDLYEIKYIKEYNSTDISIGYNIKKGGNGNSEKTNRLISKSNKNRNLSEETKNKIAIAKLGKKASTETKIKLSAAKLGNENRKGKSHSDNDKIKISKGIKKYYELEENRQKSKNIAKQRIKDGKCLKGVNIISSKENQIKATELAKLKNSKKVLIKNIETNEEIIVNSLVECRNFFKIKGNNSLIDCIKNGKTYRTIYKLKYLK